MKHVLLGLLMSCALVCDLTVVAAEPPVSEKPNIIFLLADDLGETRNLAADEPERVQAMAARLARIREEGRSRPCPPVAFARRTVCGKG